MRASAMRTLKLNLFKLLPVSINSEYNLKFAMMVPLPRRRGGLLVGQEMQLLNSQFLSPTMQLEIKTTRRGPGIERVPIRRAESTGQTNNWARPRSTVRRSAGGCQSQGSALTNSVP